MLNRASTVEIHPIKNGSHSTRHSTRVRSGRFALFPPALETLALAELALTLVLIPIALGGVCGLVACGLGWAAPSDLLQIWIAVAVCFVPLPGVLLRFLKPLFQQY